MIDPGDEGASEELVAEVQGDPALAAATLGTRAVVSLGGRTVPAYGFERLRGQAELKPLAGRLPTRDDEVALGGQTLRDLGREIGDTVDVATADGEMLPFVVVGQTAFPSLSLNATYGLGEGVAFTAEGLRSVEPNAAPSFFLVNLADGTELSSVRAHYGEDLDVGGVRRPGDIEGYASIRATPLVLAGLLAILGVGVLAHMLLTSIRNRRRDLALMKALGSTRRQLALAVAWQATTLVVIALLVGLPLGFVAGSVARGGRSWRRWA